MSESKVRRVKEIPTQVSVFLHECLLMALAVDVVANNRMTDGAEVNAYLMSSPRLDLHFEQRETAKVFEDFVFRMRGSSALCTCSHSRSDRRMARNPHIDLAGRSWKASMNQGNVFLFNAAVLKRRSKRSMRRVVLGHDQQT